MLAIDQREFLEHRTIHALKQQPEEWSYFTGDYQYLPILKDIQIQEGCLKGMEVLLAQRINQLKGLIQDRPIVITDIGGMMALSWLRLSKHFHEDVDSQRIIFKVLNINFNPDTFTPANKGRGPRISAAEFFDWQINRRNLVYVNTDITELSGCPIDIAFENKSVSYHSYIPDVKLPSILRNLSEYGMFIGGREVKPELRNLGIQIALDNFFSQLDNHNCALINRIEDGDFAGKPIDQNYSIIRHQCAPLVRLQP